MSLTTPLSSQIVLSIRNKTIDVHTEPQSCPMPVQQPANAIAAHQSGPRCLCLLLSASTRERISGPSSAA